jgi:hypothetical protein
MQIAAAVTGRKLAALRLQNRFICANRIPTFLRATRTPEGFYIGQHADTIPHIFVEVAGKFAHGHLSAAQSGQVSLVSPDALIEALDRSGYQQGKDLEIVFRLAKNCDAELPGLAAETVNLKPDDRREPTVVPRANPGRRSTAPGYLTAEPENPSISSSHIKSSTGCKQVYPDAIKRFVSPGRNRALIGAGLGRV